MTIQAKVEVLRKLLEAKTVKCPSCHGTGQGEVDTDQGHGHSAAVGCGECGGTGHIPAPLLNLQTVWEKHDPDGASLGILIEALGGEPPCH